MSYGHVFGVLLLILNVLLFVVKGEPRGTAKELLCNETEHYYLASLDYLVIHIESLRCTPPDTSFP